jgi:hypothetical protein
VQKSFSRSFMTFYVCHMFEVRLNEFLGIADTFGT